MTAKSFVMDVGMHVIDVDADQRDKCGHAIATLVAHVRAAKLHPGVSLHVVLVPGEDSVDCVVRLFEPYWRTTYEFSDFHAALSHATGEVVARVCDDVRAALLTPDRFAGGKLLVVPRPGR